MKTKSATMPKGEISPMVKNPFPGKAAAVPQSGGKKQAPKGFNGAVIPGKV